MTLTTRAGHPVEAEGRAIGGRAFCDCATSVASSRNCWILPAATINC